ncbi:hypothetical protein [Poritiphilus flavus]|uniref:Uncharacterized protein n=1 Tax=Poritiphilus flavus TaxID=2697053 RepID=A0A6L9E8F9_9FLAO|nr:hypothetical protein [Poritiphilus flavus]NAS10924.1 hypothetical protein [Poritiphilus flavus]
MSDAKTFYLAFHFLCLSKENETKEKTLFGEAFLKLRFKTEAILLNRLQGFGDSLRSLPPMLPKKTWHSSKLLVLKLAEGFSEITVLQAKVRSAV